MGPGVHSQDDAGGRLRRVAARRSIALGKDVKRVGLSTKRKDNFHPPRMMMLNLLSLDRMIANRRKLTPFPR